MAVAVVNSGLHVLEVRRKGKMIKLTESVENYLECIFDMCEREEDGRSATLTAIAKEKNVSKPSVNKALNTLKDIHFILQEPYGKITLTKDGREHALLMKERHLGIRAFLIKVLGLEQEQADIEACRIEHVISEDTIEKMIAYKG